MPPRAFLNCVLSKYTSTNGKPQSKLNNWGASCCLHKRRPIRPKDHSRYALIVIRESTKIQNVGKDNKFLSCWRLTHPINEMNRSPHARPSLSTRVANTRPEFNVPTAVEDDLAWSGADDAFKGLDWKGKKPPLTYPVRSTARGGRAFVVCCGWHGNQIHHMNQQDIPMVPTAMSHVRRMQS